MTTQATKAATTTKATARPWRASTFEGRFTIVAPWTEYVANMAAISERPGEAEANAALIVRAVNAHDALVAAGEKLTAYLESLEIGGAFVESGGRAGGEQYVEVYYHDADAFVTALRAALKLAEAM